MPEWLLGAGEMAQLIRAHDWGATPFGPREGWPQPLRTALGIVLGSRFPMTLLWGDEFRMLSNDACLEITSDRHPWALGRPFGEVFGETWSLNEPMLRRVMDQGATVYAEDRLFPIRRNGRLSEVYFTVSYSPVRLEDGRPGGVLATFVEATRQVVGDRRQRALRDLGADSLGAETAEEVGERAAAVLRGDPADVPFALVYLFDADRKGARLVAHTGMPPLSRAGQSWFPLGAEDPTGWPLARVLDRDELHLVEGEFGKAPSPRGWPDPVRSAALLRLAAPGTPAFGALVCGLAPGLVLDEGYREFLRLIATQLGGALATINELQGERARAEAALREANEELRRSETVLEEAGEMAHLGAWWIDFNGPDVDAGPLHWSDEVFRIFGYEPGAVEVTNALFFSRVHPEDRARIGEAVERAIREKQPYTLEHRVLRPDGTQRIVREHAHVQFNAKGCPVRMLGAVQDITEQKLTEEALREADRRKNEFLAMLSHELRNPLAPIRNGVHILEKAAPGGEQARRAQTIIDRQVTHMTRLIEDLLDVTRISRGKIHLRCERLELNGLLYRTAEDHRPVFAQGEIDFQLEVTDVPLYVNGDPTRLAQVVGNLLHNAAKFTPPGGRVKLSLEAADGEAVIRLRDNGTGISAETLAHLFEPFVQAEKSLDRSRGGLGLGLALVKGLTELHRGKVFAHSAGAGRGAEFVVRLPLDVPAAPRLEAVPAAAHARRVRKVLVIEDNVDAAESLKEVLELDAHVVEVAHEGREGIEKARRFRPDVILCDIGLPQMDGYQVARELRADASLSSTYVVALSGYALPEDVERSKRAGFDRHLAKPPDLVALERMLDALPRAARTA